MNKHYLYLLSILFFVSCDNSLNETNADITPEIKKNTIEIGISASDNNTTDNQSRTNINDDYSISWNSEDSIGLYTVSTDEYNVLNNKPEAPSLFSGRITHPGQAVGAVFYSTYPATSNVKNKVATFKINKTTLSSANEPIMVGTTIGSEPYATGINGINFKIITSFLRITVDEDIDSLQISGNNNEKLCGEMTYDFTSETIGLPQNGNVITAIGITANTPYNVNIPAITFEKGYKIQLFKGNETMIQSFSYGSNLDFELSKPREVNITWKPISVTLGNIKTSYENPSDGLSNSTIYSTNNSFTGISNGLVQEYGLAYWNEDEDESNANHTQATSIQSGKKFSINAATPSSDMYKVKAYIKYNNNYYYSNNTVNVGVIGNISLTQNAKTSYSYYLDNQISTANACDGSTIYTNTSIDGVNAKLIQSANVATDGSNTVNASISSYQFSASHNNQTWASHNVVSSIVLKNGQTFSSTTTQVAVTGLPRSWTPPTSSEWEKISGGSKVTFNSDNVTISGIAGAPKIITKNGFNIPNPTNIKATVECNVKGTSVLKPKFYVSSSNGSEQTTIIQCLEYNKTYKGSSAITGNGTLTSNANKIRCENTFSTAGPSTTIYSVKIEYR